MNLKSTQRDTLLSDGNYNKKTWVDDEIIYKEDLNTLEDIAYKNREAILQQNEKIDQIPTMSDVDKIDYMGKQHTTLKSASDANMEYLLRKVNTQKYEGSSITATNTYAKQISNVILKGVTKFKDMDTGEFIDEFEEGRNLELVGGKTNKVFSKNKCNVKDLICVRTSQDKFTYEVIDENTIKLLSAGTSRWSRIVFNFNYESGEKYVIKFDSDNEKSWCMDFNGDLGNRTTFDKSIAFEKEFSPKGSEPLQFANISGNEDITLSNFYISKSIYKNIPYQSSYIQIPYSEQLHSIGDTVDYIDLIAGVCVKNIGTRKYQEGDELDDQLMTDMKNTLYKLEKSVITKLEINDQKVYSYDGITYYSCESEIGYPSPILSLEVPTDLASLVNEQSNKIVELQSINKEQDEIINTSLLATDEIYMMLEPLLVNSLAVDQSNKMVNLYVAMVQRGLKDKEEVPAIYKEQVSKELEK